MKAVKKKISGFMKDERGVAITIEAAIIYPVVFLFLAFLIYVGLYIMQNMTVASYAEKVAMLAAREVACPGYIDMFADNVFNTAAVEGDTSNGAIKVSLQVDSTKVDTKPYRYWSSDPLGAQEKTFRGILTKMVKDNSILGAGEVKAKIKCDNCILTQYIDVEVSQELMHFAVLDFFGVESPTIKCAAKASVGDTDEFIRNVDLAGDALEAIAEKCGIDITKVKEKVIDIKNKFGL